MKKATTWKLFFVLLVSTCVAAFTVLPYMFALSPNLQALFTPQVIAIQIVQYIVLFSLAVFFGLDIGARVGFGAPILEKALAGEKSWVQLKSIILPSIGWGVVVGAVIIAVSLLMPALSLSLLKMESAVSLWKLLLVPFYGGIVEETLMRLFLMSVFVWIFSKFSKTTEGKPTAFAIWSAIVVTAVLFGLGHLPMTGDLTAITPLVVTRAILLNGVAGIIFGMLYWKRGLESAMISHFSADVVLHVITPLIAAAVL